MPLISQTTRISVSARVSLVAPTPSSNPCLLTSSFKSRCCSTNYTYQATTSLFTLTRSCSPLSSRLPHVHLNKRIKGQFLIGTYPSTYSKVVNAIIMASVPQQNRHVHSHGSGGHTHSHGENAYLTSHNKSDAGVRITRIGLYCNLGMAVIKGVGGYTFNSKALIADAIHSLTDLVSDFMTLATVSLALKPPSKQFPSGYGKVESLGSLGVSGILLIGGVLMGWSAVLSLAQEFLPGMAELLANLGMAANGHGHSHIQEHLPADGPSIHAAWLALGSILTKEWLYHATLKIAKERKSAVLAANAYHHRVDSLTAFVALLMIGGANVLENASWMDPIGGLVISLMVIQAGLGNTKASLLELADAGLDDDIKRRVRRAVEKGIAEAGSEKLAAVVVRQVQGVKAGQSYLIDMELGVPGAWTVNETRQVEETLRARVGGKVRGVKRVRIRFVPKEDAVTPGSIAAPPPTLQGVDALDEFIPADVSPRSSPEPESDDDHDHNHSHSHDSSNGHHPKSK